MSQGSRGISTLESQNQREGQRCELQRPGGLPADCGSSRSLSQSRKDATGLHNWSRICPPPAVLSAKWSPGDPWRAYITKPLTAVDPQWAHSGQHLLHPDWACIVVLLSGGLQSCLGHSGSPKEVSSGVPCWRGRVAGSRTVGSRRGRARKEKRRIGRKCVSGIESRISPPACATQALPSPLLAEDGSCILSAG